MDGDQIARFAYLALLGLAVGGWFFAESRRSLGRSAKHATIWGLIFLGVIAAAGLWSDIRDDLAPRQSVMEGSGEIVVPRHLDGHYYLTLDINDAPVRFVVDTGATEMVLTRQDARRVGIDVDDLLFTGRARTANGVVETAPAWLDEVTLGPVVDRGVRVSVNGGAMENSLLGMTYLQRFDSLRIEDNRLVLTR